MEQNDIVVKSVNSQHSLKNIQGHSVRLDIFAEDSSGKKFNIEIQRQNKGAGTRRARYISSIIDANILSQSQDYSQLADTYVIFITENDVIGCGEPIYHINRIIKETNTAFGDGSHIIYVNGSYRGNDIIGKLMHDFHCTNPNDMNFSKLSKKVKYYKSDEGGISNMSKIMEEFAEEIRRETNRNIVLNLRLMGFDLDKISKATELTIDEVQTIINEKSA